MMSKKVLLAVSLLAVLLVAFAVMYAVHGQIEVVAYVKSLYENITVSIEKPLEIATKSLYEYVPNIEDPHPWVS